MGFDLSDYEPVASRLDRFLKAHPDARVITDLVHYLSDVAVFKCELWLEGEIIATGWAEEVRGQGNVNKTSHLENCETGAVGRALANAGLSGSDFNKRPSREEMGKVVRRQNDTQVTENGNLASDKQQNMIRAVCKSMGKVPPHNLQSFTKREASAYIDSLKADKTTQTHPTHRRTILMIAVSEQSFLTQVKALAYQYGWALHHAQPSMTRTGRYITTGATGFPDLVLAHHERGLIFAELKTEKGKASDAQDNWLRILHPHAECYLWRPSDLTFIAQRLASV